MGVHGPARRSPHLRRPSAPPLWIEPDHPCLDHLHDARGSGPRNPVASLRLHPLDETRQRPSRPDRGH
jgi:hypothetical protein